MKDYHSILGVASDASEEEIKRAYKKLAMKHHPDRGGDQAKFQEIQEAYATLTDPERRAQWERSKFAQQNGGPRNQFNWFESNDINDIINQFTGFGGFRQAQMRNRDLRTQIAVTLASTLEAQKQHVEIKYSNGTSKTIEINVPRGVQNGVQMRCAGLGEHTIPNLPPGDLYVDFFVHPNSDFRVEGINLVKTFHLSCIDAMLGFEATVKNLENNEFSVKIPAGTTHGTKFRLPGHGLWQLNHPVRGDLLIEIDIIIPKTISKEQYQQLKSITKE